jgi:hypothetical protein
MYDYSPNHEDGTIVENKKTLITEVMRVFNFLN